jgi:hypothetical protein
MLAAMDVWLVAMVVSGFSIGIWRWSARQPARAHPVGDQLRVGPPLLGRSARDLWFSLWIGLLGGLLVLNLALGSWAGAMLGGLLLLGLVGTLAIQGLYSALVFDRGRDCIRQGSILVSRASAVLAVDIRDASGGTPLQLVLRDHQDRLVLWRVPDVESQNARNIGVAIASYLDVPVTNPRQATAGVAS